jgi:RNA polymerase-binding transcription factor DksA
LQPSLLTSRAFLSREVVRATGATDPFLAGRGPDGLPRVSEGEAIVTQHELEDYRRQLVRMANRLEGDVSRLSDEALRRAGGEASGNLSNTPLHLADLGTDTFEHEMTLGLLENEGQVFIQITNALDRIDNGTFGRCENCGAEIRRERLQALPYVNLCIRCAHLLQPGEAPRGMTGA